MYMRSLIKNLPHYGDIFAIPFFLFTAIYFYYLDDKTIVEYCLLIFAIGGFLADILFTYLYFAYKV